jgi:hypothetical protein
MTTPPFQTAFAVLTAAFLASTAVLCAQDTAKKPAAEAPTAKSGELKVGEFTFRAAEKWKLKAEPAMMSRGGFELEAEKGADPLAADFYHFGAGGGGGAAANVARWKGQFRPAKDGEEVPCDKEEKTIGGTKVTIVQIRGTYVGRGQDSKSGHAMLGAIIESSAGDVFVKMVGPEKAVQSAKEAFEKLISSPFPAPAETKPGSSPTKPGATATEPKKQ